MSHDYGSTSHQDYGIAFAGQGGAGSSNMTDSAIRFSRICESITSNIFAITKHASTLEKTLKVIGSVNDSKAVRESVHVVQVTANSTLKSTMDQFSQLKLILEGRTLPNNGRDERNRERKLSSDFQTAIKRYYELQKEIVAKMKRSIVRVESLTASVTTGGETEDEGLLEQDQEAQRQAQIQLQEALEFEQGLLIEREEKIRQIESDILDVNSIMKEISTMISEQGDTIDTIEGHVETAYTEVDTGREELQKASAYQTTYRKRLICLLGTAFIVLVIVVTILIVELKH